MGWWLLILKIGDYHGYIQNTFGRIFWVDDNNNFKSCPQNVDGTGDFNCSDYVDQIGKIGRELIIIYSLRFTSHAYLTTHGIIQTH